MKPIEPYNPDFSTLTATWKGTGKARKPLTVAQVTRRARTDLAMTRLERAGWHVYAGMLIAGTVGALAAGLFHAVQMVGAW